MPFPPLRGHATPAEAEAAAGYLRAFIDSTRQALFVRRADGVLFIRPDKTLRINASGASILEALYNRDGVPPIEAIHRLAPTLGAPIPRLLDDARALLDTLAAMLSDDFSPRPNLRLSSFQPGILRYPTLSEIALTYACQNRCGFCYASSPSREGEHRLMTTAEVERVMQRIFEEAHVPSLSFTGGEATLRPDLPRLITRARELGFRVNLITNGRRAADPAYAALLAASGLDSAQVSLEAGEANLHDAIVGRDGAFVETVAGIRALVREGLHVHTNSTLCAKNLDAAPSLIRFVARDLGLRTLSLNMVIRTGVARGRTEMEVSYATVGKHLPGLIRIAADEGVKLVWYSPIPYCIFNPVLHGLGAKSCACVDGILSVDPAGMLLPCSSFATGLGSLLDTPFEHLRASRAATYFRTRRYLPPACAGCPDTDLCSAGCPLYWDAAGSFAELPRPGSNDPSARRRWERERQTGRSFGVPPPLGSADRDPLRHG